MEFESFSSLMAEIRRIAGVTMSVLSRGCLLNVSIWR